MEAIRIHTVVETDGEIILTGLPLERGQHVEMILLTEPLEQSARPHLTARKLLQSRLVGLWEDRDDIEDSSAYARQLRERAQQRQDRL